MSGRNSKEVRKLTAEVQQQARALEEFRNSPILQQLEISKTSAFSGPVPPPEMVEQYNLVCPGLGNELVKSYIEEQQFRRELERDDLGKYYERVEESQGQSKMGLILGFCVVVILVGYSAYAMHLGHAGFAQTIMGVLVTAASVFVGHNQLSKQKEKKNKEESDSQDHTPEKI
jgi:uncharacterized membrane protein